MSEYMWRHMLAHARCFRGCANGFLNDCLVNVMTAYRPGLWIFGAVLGSKDILPDEFPIGIWVLACQRVWQVDGPLAFGEVFLMHAFDEKQIGF